MPLDTKSSPALRPIRPDEFLPSVSRWTTLGGLMLIGMVGAVLSLAAVLRLNVTVRASAIVRPSGEVRLVQAREGTIAQIDVEPNQAVRQGDPIARLDRTPLETQKNQLSGSLQQLQLQTAQLDAQLRLFDRQIAAQSRSLSQEVQVAQAELDRSRSEYAERQATTQADLAEAEAALAFARSEQQRYQQLVESGAVSQLQLEEKRAAVAAAAARVARAQAALNPSGAPVTIAQDRIAQADATARATLDSLNREREALIQQRSELQAQIIRDRQALQQTEAELQASVIRAPSDGVVLRLNLRNPGQVVQSGETIAEIAPSQAGLMIRAQVATQDINQIQVGQSAQMRIAACPFPDFGTLRGTVTAVSPDAIAPEAPPPAPDRQTAARYYEATIEPEATALERGDRQCPLQAGMEAEANITARRETFLRFVLRKARLLTF